MKRSILALLATALVGFNGCGGVVQSMTVYEIDPSLARLQNLKALPQRNAIGFEWARITDRKVRGINVYRSSGGEETHIATISNAYATHFVDTQVKPGRSYRYTFKTLRFGKEAALGSRIKVRALAPLPSVPFLKAYKVGAGTVKLLWAPHSNESIDAYIIERSVNGGEWRYIAQVKGRIMVEYIDTFVRPERNYRYRIIAKSYDDTTSRPSQPTHIRL
ncbi:fibronectin type III domain-containing protein [Sulfurovum mangrovi]|uniref:fibronectin type III domain-containing protein n=1 Tax=Sulfurovum mangrovi TaxID=2893889 RepID=UPI001E61DE96|nr:hypothetical protein [Sulfurovum mangrovi]UFH58659.1 hypothetical protein LN246_09890 [Sulfurovum mangrovi]